MLANKKLVIIGGTTGIGLSAARAFVREGASLVILGIDDVDPETRSSLPADKVRWVTGDATELVTSINAIDTCIEAFGDFDGLYHVAGGSGRKMVDGPLDKLTLEGWNHTLKLNVTSVMLSNQAAVKRLIKLKKAGTILNMSSVLAFSPSAEFFSTHAYAAAKSAIIGFSKSVAAYYAYDNIRINVIAPGLVDTPMSQRASGDEAIRAFIHYKQPLDGGRMGKPADLDGLAVFFMSDQSGYITGQVVAVDGGWSVSEGNNTRKED